MAYTAIYANGSTFNMVKKFVIDSFNEIYDIDTSQLSPGSTTFDISSNKTYMLNNKKQWIQVQVGTGGSGDVQSDWNQNDETAADYIKNRPFYTGDTVETVFVEESTITFAENNGLYIAQFPSTFRATVGDTYKVSWDGASYECTCVLIKNLPAIGNPSIMSVGSDTGEPFLIGVDNGKRIAIVTADTSASHTVSISGFVQEIVKIDEKYLPDNLAIKSDVETAQTTANAAQSTAEKAQFIANTAQSTAENAQSIANTAKSTANTAKSTAENAQSITNAAQSTANTAKSTAENAQSIAENAQSIAENAQSIANTAKSTANTAKTAAENAQSTANTAKTEVAKALTVSSSGSITAPVNIMNTGTYQVLNITSKDQRHSAQFGVTKSIGLQIRVGRDGGMQADISNPSTLEFSANGGSCMRLKGIDELIMNSSTTDSTKKFKITVDDSGTLTATEVT